MSLKDYLTKKPVLETERLILRELKPEDTDDLREWMSDPGLYLYWGKRPGRHDLNPELLFTAANRRPTKSFHWGIANKKDNKVIGEFWVYLIENDRMAKVSYRLSPACQGNGLMTETLKRISASRARNFRGSGPMWTWETLPPAKRWKRPASHGRAASDREKWSLPGVTTIYTVC